MAKVLLVHISVTVGITGNKWRTSMLVNTGSHYGIRAVVAFVANLITIRVSLTAVAGTWAVVLFIGHAITVPVRIADIPYPVFIAVCLIRVGHVRTTVACVAHFVPVFVLLIGVGQGRTVVEHVDNPIRVRVPIHVIENTGQNPTRILLFDHGRINSEPAVIGATAIVLE